MTQWSPNSFVVLDADENGRATIMVNSEPELKNLQFDTTHDREEALDAKIMALIVRLHQLRVRLQGRAPKALVDWEILHEQLDNLNDGRIRLILQAKETAVDEWIAMSDLANTINKKCDQLESHWRLVNSATALMYFHVRLHESLAETP